MSEATFRARDEQIDEMHDAIVHDVCSRRFEYPPQVFKAYLERNILEAEERGAARVRAEMGTEIARLREVMARIRDSAPFCGSMHLIRKARAALSPQETTK